MEYKNRKQLRLKNYDYSLSGAYFITLCVKDKQKLLSEIIVGDGVLDVTNVKLSNFGKIVHNQIENMNAHYKNIYIDKFVIMPNHIHFIIIINACGSSRTPTPTNATLPSFVSTFKRFVNKELGFSLFERSYYDHVIRDELDYQKIWKYIDENPIKWNEDKYYE